MLRRTPDQLFKPAGFSIPKHMVEVRHRLFRNLSFYFTNYIAFTLFILFYEMYVNIALSFLPQRDSIIPAPA